MHSYSQCHCFISGKFLRENNGPTFTIQQNLANDDERDPRRPKEEDQTLLHLLPILHLSGVCFCGQFRGYQYVYVEYVFVGVWRVAIH